MGHIWASSVPVWLADRKNGMSDLYGQDKIKVSFTSLDSLYEENWGFVGYFRGVVLDACIWSISADMQVTGIGIETEQAGSSGPTQSKSL